MAELKTKQTEASVDGKVCVYIKRLSDIDVAVLEKLVKASVAEVRERYPS